MTNKTKNILLLAGFLLALVLCYKLAIEKTLNLKHNYKILKQEEVLFTNIPKQFSLLKQKEKHYNALLTKYKLNGSSIQNNLLKTINTFAEANNIQVITFLEPHIHNERNLTLKTYRFTLQGRYDAILKLIHTLEQQTKFGEITNLHFEKKKNFKTGKSYLQAQVLLKSFG